MPKFRIEVDIAHPSTGDRRTEVRVWNITDPDDTIPVGTRTTTVWSGSYGTRIGEVLNELLED